MSVLSTACGVAHSSGTLSLLVDSGKARNLVDTVAVFQRAWRTSGTEVRWWPGRHCQVQGPQGLRGDGMFVTVIVKALFRVGHACLGRLHAAMHPH